MTPAEARGWNAAISTMVDIANRSAAAVTTTGRRPLVEGFAVAALAELAQAGRALLLPINPDKPEATLCDPGPRAPSGPTVAEAVP